MGLSKSLEPFSAILVSTLMLGVSLFEKSPNILPSGLAQQRYWNNDCLAKCSLASQQAVRYLEHGLHCHWAVSLAEGSRL